MQVAGRRRRRIMALRTRRIMVAARMRDCGSDDEENLGGTGWQ